MLLCLEHCGQAHRLSLWVDKAKCQQLDRHCHGNLLEKCLPPCPCAHHVSPDPHAVGRPRSLSARLSGIERKLAQLDDGSRLVLLEAGGSWLGALQADDGDGKTAGSTGAEEEEAEAGVAARASMTATVTAAAAPQPE